MAIVEEVEMSEVHATEEELENSVEETEAKIDAKAEEEKPKASAVKPATAPEPAAPAAPELKVSQIVPMVVMLGLQKFNLEELGYVEHVPGKDKREKRMQLTDVGRKIYDDVRVTIDEYEQEILKGISEEEQLEVIRIMGDIRNNIRE